MTSSFLGVRHEGLDPITFNQFLPRAKSKLKLITTIGRGMMPVILENFDIPNCSPTDQYLKTIPLTLEPRSTEPRSSRQKSDNPVLTHKVRFRIIPDIELKRIDEPIEAAPSFKGISQHKGIMDIEGDKTYGVRTIAVVHGKKVASYFVVLFVTLALLLCIIPMINQTFGLIFIIAVIAFIILIIQTGIPLIKNPNYETAKNFKNYLLPNMFIALVLAIIDVLF